MACKIIYKGKALPEEEAKIEINNDVVDDLNEQAVGKSIINSALLTDEEINQQITDLNKFKTVIENNYFKLEDNISVSSLVINKHIKNAPASLGKVKIDSKWRTKEEAKKQVEENLKQRKLFSKLKRNFGITEEQLNLIENVPADKAISSAEDLINAIESKLLSLNSLVLNSKKSKSATLQQKEQAKTIEQLFNENPELANGVYEALGFKTKADVILPIGTSGSGKSTFIKSLPQENLVVIEPDAMRVEFTGDMNNKSKDKEIYEEAAKRAVQAIKQGKQVVFDTTNLTKDKRLPFIQAIKKEIPNANIQYKLMELNPELAKQRIKAQLVRGENRAAVSDETIDRHTTSYKQMLDDIKNEPISNFEISPQQKQQAQQLYQSFLDVYLQDFEQVEKILKEEKVIDKKCS